MPEYHACYAFNKTRPPRPPRPARNWKELVTQMHSKPPPAPPRTESTVIHVTDGVNSTLCGRSVSRNMDIFEPREATCRECKRRWELATGVR